ncbi:hypothetical protein [Nocardia sp. NPDC059239]|uniref:hypothetical protein n=1 Tax=Nocardia sp. NPDC059239 TaxID=3346785 RepID=UPI0036AC8B11
MLGHTDWMNAMAFATTTDGTLVLASGSYDTSVQLWDIASDTSIGEPLTGHIHWVNAVACATTADGTLLLASSGKNIHVSALVARTRGEGYS